MDGDQEIAILPDINSLLPSDPCVTNDESTTESSLAVQGQSKSQIIKSGPDDGAPLTKSALKKIRRQQRFEDGKAERKAKKKEKRKAKQEERREAKLAGDTTAATKPVKQQLVQTKVPVTLVLDASFDSLMTDKEIISLCGQTSRCYHDVRNARYRPILAVTSFGGRMKERFETVLKGQYKNWKGVQFVEDDISRLESLATEWMKDIKAVSIGERDANNAAVGVESPKHLAETADNATKTKQAKIVYLSADSDKTLNTLEPYTCYVIGALVDRNRHKGICFEAAEKAGIATARLPIGEFISMSSRKVLTTNHVVEIMVKYMETKDWKRSFLEVIPMRKGAGSKDLEIKEGNDEDDFDDRLEDDAPNSTKTDQSPC